MLTKAIFFFAAIAVCLVTMPNNLNFLATLRNLTHMTLSEQFTHISSNNLYYVLFCIITARISWFIICYIPILFNAMIMSLLESQVSRTRPFSCTQLRQQLDWFGADSTVAWINSSLYGGNLPHDCLLSQITRFATRLHKEFNTGSARQNTGSQPTPRPAIAARSNGGTPSDAGTAGRGDGLAGGERGARASGANGPAALIRANGEADEGAGAQRAIEHIGGSGFWNGFLPMLKGSKTASEATLRG